MHIYLYESNLNEKRFASALAKVETRITDLGLNGKIIRLGITHSLDTIIHNELKNGAKTIVIVGSFLLLHKAINSVALMLRQSPAYKDVPLGYIPLNTTTKEINSFFGITDIEMACDILSARRVQNLDLGKINNTYFLTFCQITTKNTTLEIDNNYSIEIKQSGDVFVVNLPAGLAMPQEAKAEAKDQTLELFIRTRGRTTPLPRLGSTRSLSVFPFKNLRIINNQHSIIVDQVLQIKAPADISVARIKINLIVGKNRSF